MTTSEENSTELTGDHLEALKKNLEKVESLSKRLVEVMAGKTSHNPSLNAPNHEVFAKAASAYWSE
ncbi:MAG: class I poly(R)-hydroxyalkanoic acid synthase, partial [Pseudomonadota bacterium]